MYTKFVEGGGSWMISSTTLWIAFFVVIILFLIATVVLYHYWNAYIAYSQKLEMAKQLYMRVSFFLLGVMTVTLLFYTL
ncbi:MAG: hypothetical protein V1652_01090 [bacterium]